MQLTKLSFEFGPRGGFVSHFLLRQPSCLLGRSGVLLRESSLLFLAFACLFCSLLCHFCPLLCHFCLLLCLFGVLSGPVCPLTRFLFGPGTRLANPRLFVCEPRLPLGRFLCGNLGFQGLTDGRVVA
jgi:hypothetical protein